jgi:hypothetical protein
MLPLRSYWHIFIKLGTNVMPLEVTLHLYFFFQFLPSIISTWPYAKLWGGSNITAYSVLKHCVVKDLTQYASFNKAVFLWNIKCQYGGCARKLWPYCFPFYRHTCWRNEARYVKLCMEIIHNISINSEWIFFKHLQLQSSMRCKTERYYLVNLT